MAKEHPTGAEQVTWDLSDLYGSTADPAIDRDLDQADARADRLAAGYRGRVAALPPEEMRGLLAEYEAVMDLAGKVGTYAYLGWSTGTEDAARGALLQRFNERYSRLHQKLLFLELEWAHAPEEAARALMDSPVLAHYRHWLEVARLYRPHLLSEAEEKVLAEKAVTGRQAWIRYFDEAVNAARYELDGERVPQSTILTRLYEPDREARRRAAASFTTGLAEMKHTTTYVFNTVLADKASDDRLRSYPSWISARNLDNQVDDATVEALVEAVTGRYDIVARYYRLKRRLLGLGELYDYDRYAPLPAADRRYGWAEARERVLEAYRKFHPRMAEIAAQFFDRRWIDAAVQPGKRSGAFSHGAVPSVHPYVLLNYEGSSRDVMTLAHELGHGVHQWLARGQGILLADTPLTTAETASVFGEMLVFQDLIDAEPDPRIRLAMLVRKIEDSFATVFRQVAMNRFEEAIHRARRGEGELDTARLSELWLDTQRRMFQESVSLSEDYGIWWSYIPHFIHTPGYVYAYAFGELLVLALHQRYQESAARFPELYLSMLAAGGSRWPAELAAPLGVDLKDPGFWSRGLAMLDRLVAQAEEEAGGQAAGGASAGRADATGAGAGGHAENRGGAIHMTRLNSGDRAPEFSLPDQEGRTVRLADFSGKQVLVYFYPKADTSGCTAQACSVRDARQDLRGLSMDVVGISPDAPDAQKRFDRKYTLGFPLLSDPDHAVAEAYGVWGEKVKDGKKRWGIIRSSFLIDGDGRIRRAWYGIRPEDTVPEALAAAGSPG
jgi:oligoendopeptidase F